MDSHIYTMLAALDHIIEDAPPLSFTNRPQWPLDETSDVQLAALHLLDGCWLCWLGTWCPETLTTLHWDTTVFVETDDDPLGFQLLSHGVFLRQLGCSIASSFADPRALAPVRAAITSGTPSPQEVHLRTLLVELMAALYAQRDQQTDWFGNPLPLSIATISALADSAAPYPRQGDTSQVTLIRLHHDAYFLKQRIQPGSLLGLYEGFVCECSVGALIRALPFPLVAAMTRLFVTTDGVLTLLTTKVPGVAMRDIRRAASRVSLASVQAAVLAEYLYNCQDRHDGNLFIDRIRAQPWLIDFAPSLDPAPEDTLLLPSPHESWETQREAFTRALWVWHPDRLQTPTGESVILSDVLAGIVDAQPHLFAVAEVYALSTEAQSLIARRLALLQQLLNEEGPTTLEQLNRLAQH